MQSHTSPEEKKFECPNGSQAFRIWLLNPDALRNDGYTPARLNGMGKKCLSEHKKIRGEMLYNKMLQFDPTAEEAPTFASSGDVLDKLGYGNNAVTHWCKAFENGYRPYEMNMKLGQGLLGQGRLSGAHQVFTYQTSATARDPISYNELGVTQFMQALQHKDPNQFYQLQNNALGSFKKSLEIRADDPIVSQNIKVASVLNALPTYGEPHRNLPFKPSCSTRMIDSIMQGLAINQEQTKNDSAVGFTLTTDSKDGPNLAPTIVSYSYKIPRFPNILALNELSKLKREQASSDHDNPPPSFSLK